MGGAALAAGVAHLSQLLAGAARRAPENVAVEQEDGQRVTYAELADLTGRVASFLAEAGIGPGDRVGVCLEKSIGAVASLYGALQVGAAYVPVDPAQPVERAAFVLSDCAVRGLIAERPLADRLLCQPGLSGKAPGRVLALDEPAVAGGLGRALAHVPARVAAPPDPTGDQPAYVLYTSGSTGVPKGVVLSHANALSFLGWSSRTFAPVPSDRFASHAPFHFDLSILDVFLPALHGATVLLVGEATGKAPRMLAPLIAERGITIWYSTPSVLTALVESGALRSVDLTALRLVLFAGEVFPVQQLRRLRERIPSAALWNLYGPTETNVVTAFRVPDDVPADRTGPYPIGTACDHARIRIVDDDLRSVPVGGSGELCVSGPSVMLGYWNRDEATRAATFRDADGTRWYRTGDQVAEQPDGNLAFVGRRDRMVKRRGYRVELAEIEAGLYRHDLVAEAAVVVSESPESGVRLIAFLAFSGGDRPSIIELKSFCARVLPAYMVPDVFRISDRLPRTSTGKVDYPRLTAALG